MRIRLAVTSTVIVLNVLLPAGIAGETATLEIWAVDPLVKVFRDATPVSGDALAEVARGEHASLQIVVRCKKDIKNLRAQTGFLALASDRSQRLQSRPARFVGYVPVTIPTPKPPKNPLRKLPADFPDPLLEVKTMNVAAGRAQPIWITVAVPIDAAPGTYQGKVSVSGQVASETVSASIPTAIRVYPVKVGPSRLWVTNWFNMGSQQAAHLKVTAKPDTPEFSALLRRYARNMADHRQNAAKISPLSLANFKPGENGQLDIDFSRFDQRVELFIDEGVIGLIEGGHIGTRTGDWKSSFIMFIRRVEGGKIVSDRVDPASPEADRFYEQFLPALVQHLRVKGWLDQYVQHLADEPIPENIKSYLAMAKVVRRHAPELRIIEACHTKDLVGGIDVWVPQLNFLHQDYEYYRQRQAAGEQIWFYTCLGPQGEYANRFVEQRLIKTRLLHWINFRYGVTGYLHWGYNHWPKGDPFEELARKFESGQVWPAGDAYIVYPGPDGPWDSIRWEAMRDGIADYELLSMLADRDREAAMRLATKHVLDFDKYDTSVESLRATRRELLAQLTPLPR